jgi:hypothetical protein
MGLAIVHQFISRRWVMDSEVFPTCSETTSTEDRLSVRERSELFTGLTLFFGLDHAARFPNQRSLSPGGFGQVRPLEFDANGCSKVVDPGFVAGVIAH